MPIAPDLSALKQRLDSFFWRNQSPEMRLLKDILSEHFSQFESVAVVGGLVRDFAREGRVGFRSDVDLVINTPAHEVAAVANILGARANRFGGYGAKIGVWRIDFWALETTWAAQSAGIPVSDLKDITRCTFFDWDAIAYDLRDRSVLCDASYLDRLRLGILEVSLYPTPSLEGNLLRAMRRLVLWKLRPGPVLMKFIVENLNERVFNNIQRKELELYPSSVSSMWTDVESARRDLLEFDRYPAQYSFGFDDAAFTTIISDHHSLGRKVFRRRAGKLSEVPTLPGLEVSAATLA